MKAIESLHARGIAFPGDGMFLPSPFAAMSVESPQGRLLRSWIALVAQRQEHSLDKREVPGSNPGASMGYVIWSIVRQHRETGRIETELELGGLLKKLIFILVAIAAGFWHNVALRSDGHLLVWGSGGGTPPPELTNIVAISAGFDFSTAIA